MTIDLGSWAWIVGMGSCRIFIIWDGITEVVLKLVVEELSHLSLEGGCFFFLSISSGCECAHAQYWKSYVLSVSRIISNV